MGTPQASPGIPTIAEALRQAGYRTAAFISGFPLDRRFGLDRGFVLYDDRLPLATTSAALLWDLDSAP